MKKASCFSIFLGAAILIIFSSSFAGGPPSLFFDCNGDGISDTVCNLDPDNGNRGLVEIWLGDWDKSAFADEKLFGIKMFFYYDEKQVQLNESNSFANDTEHGGPLDPEFCRILPVGKKTQIDIAAFNCAPVSDKILLYTLELESISGGGSDIAARLEFNGRETGGVVVPGGDSCSAPHPEGGGDAAARVVFSTPSKGIFGKIKGFFKGLWK